MNIPPPSMSTPPDKESTSQTIARFFDRVEDNDPDQTRVNKALPTSPPIIRPPTRRPMPPSPQPHPTNQAPQTPEATPQPHPANQAPQTPEATPLEATPQPGGQQSALRSEIPMRQPKRPLSVFDDPPPSQTSSPAADTNPVPPTRKMPAVRHPNPKDDYRALDTSQPGDRKWLFGAAFGGLTVLGIGLAIVALTAAANMADSPASTDDTSINSQTEDILPDGNSPLGVATIEGNESAPTSSTSTQKRRSTPAPAPAPASPTTQPAPTSTAIEEQASPPSEKPEDTQVADQPDATDTPPEDSTQENQEQLEPEPPPSTTAE